jgi:predicted SnoaL-like aldol condensation-catalyzing enzyme
VSTIDALWRTTVTVRLTDMKNNSIRPIAFLSSVLFVAACGGSQTNGSTDAPHSGSTATHKEQVIALLSSIQSGDPSAASIINQEKFIQHDLSEADGVAGFAAVLAQLPKGSARVHVVRAFEDGEFVFTHTEYNFFGPKIGFDVFRFANGKIVEHWDNLQETSASPNPSGRTMTDGPTDAGDTKVTEDNKALVRAFLNDVIVNGHADKVPAYLSPDFHQHNPLEADGIGGLGAFLQSQAAAGTPLTFTRVHSVYGEGSFVLSASEGSFKGQLSAFYDLFRVDGGKIVEHWDTIQTIPPRSEWKNGNGKF